VQAVARQLVSRDVVPDLAGRRGRGEQVPEEVAELSLRSGQVLAPVHERRQVGAVVRAGTLVGDARVGLEHHFEPLARVGGSVPDLGEVLQMVGHVALVPGDQDRLDVREVLVQRCPSDAGLIGDLGHRHRGQPVLGHERRRGVQRGLPHGVAVRLDRVVPEPRHHDECTSRRLRYILI
jgi:hypothetical protein